MRSRCAPWLYTWQITLVVMGGLVASVGASCASGPVDIEDAPAETTVQEAREMFRFHDVSAARILGGGCGVTENGAVYCWEDLDFPDRSMWRCGENCSRSFESVSAGLLHVCGLSESGRIECWGGVDGSDDEDRLRPELNAGQASPPEGTFVEVSAGYRHTCAIEKGGGLRCWGGGAAGQSNPPAGEFRQVSAGAAGNCAIRNDGRLACWGCRRDEVPRRFAGCDEVPDGRFRHVDVGGSHACAVRRSGGVECWGANPPRVEPPDGEFDRVVVSYRRNCGLLESGRVRCWGRQPSNERDRKRLEFDGFLPAPDPPSGKFSQISGGGRHFCALGESGEVACWGPEDNSGEEMADPPPLTFDPCGSRSTYEGDFLEEGDIREEGDFLK